MAQPLDAELRRSAAWQLPEQKALPAPTPGEVPLPPAPAASPLSLSCPPTFILQHEFSKCLVKAGLCCSIQDSVEMQTQTALLSSPTRPCQRGCKEDLHDADCIFPQEHL